MTKRLSLSLEKEDEAMLARFAEEDSPERRVLINWTSMQGMAPGQIRSEAALLRALLRFATERLREEAMEEGYAMLAAELDTVEQAETREARRRYIRRSEAASST